MRNRNYCYAAAAAIPLFLAPLTTVAQDGAAKPRAPIEEILVSATKREEKLQDVAVSVTALSAESMQNMGFQSITQLTQQVPNFSVQGLFGPSGPPFLNIRGVSFIDYTDMNESSIGLYVDEIYQGATAAAAGQLFDVQRMEILRGPQGTLFGRNTTGGLLHYISKKPTNDFEAYASYQYGSYEQNVLEAAAGGPITDNWLARIAFKSNHDEGFQKNRVTGGRLGATDIQASRFTTTWEATENLSATLSYHYAKSDGSIPGYAVYGTRTGAGTPSLANLCSPDQVDASDCVARNGFRDPNPSPTHTYSDMNDLPNDYTADGGYLNIDWNLGWADLTAISGIEKYKRFSLQDIDAYDSPIDQLGFYDNKMRQFSQEVRLAGESSNIKWVGGLFYYSDNRDTHSQYQINRAILLQSSAEGETESKAVFAQADIPLAEQWTFVAGARYTWEDRDLIDSTNRNAAGNSVLCAGDTTGAGCIVIPSYSTNITTNKPTYKASLEWRPNTDVLTYLQFTSGFKSGSFGVSIPSNVAAIGPVGAETVDAWELGAKTTWLDGRLRANVSAFYYDYANYQAIVGGTNSSGVPTSFFVNAGDVDIKGAEAELTYVPIDQLELNLGLSTLSSEISAPSNRVIANYYGQSLPIDGNELPSAPAYSVNGSIAWHQGLDDLGMLTFQTSFKYQDDVYFNIDNNPFKKQDAYGIVNFRMIWESVSGRYRGEAFVDNATNEEYQVHRFQSAGFDTAYGGWGMPRWYGAKFTVKY
ncbi:MAG: TonB-dependent receptor [Spongiibacteraceae bacterium]